MVLEAAETVSLGGTGIAWGDTLVTERDIVSHCFVVLCWAGFKAALSEEVVVADAGSALRGDGLAVQTGLPAADAGLLLGGIACGAL